MRDILILRYKKTHSCNMGRYSQHLDFNLGCLPDSNSTSPDTENPSFCAWKHEYAIKQFTLCLSLTIGEVFMWYCQGGMAIFKIWIK